MRICDRLEIADKRRTNDGYLVTAARFARAGLYDYAGAELGRPDKDVIRVYRSEDEVFNQDAMASFAHKPITNDHPTANVTAKTWKRDAVGFSDGRVARDGDYVVIPLMVTDEDAISDVDGGKCQLSAGYDCDIEFVDGELENGQKYDAIMTNIRGNHIALVDRGRAGPECRIGDEERGERKVPDLKLVLVDGLSVETTEQGERAILKLSADVKDRDTRIDKLIADHEAALAAKDAELATKDGEIADLKGKVLDENALDQRVSDRAALVATATKIIPAFDAKGKTEAQIRREVVQSKRGDAVKDKSDAYIDAAFDVLVEGLGDGTVDPIADAVRSGDGNVGLPTNFNADQARADAEKAEREANDVNAWRTKQTA